MKRHTYIWFKEQRSIDYCHTHLKYFYDLARHIMHLFYASFIFKKAYSFSQYIEANC